MSEDKPSQEGSPLAFRFNIADDFYKDGISVYQNGAVHLNVGGMVYVKSIKGWFECWKEIERLEAENKLITENLEKAIYHGHKELSAEKAKVERLRDSLERIENNQWVVEAPVGTYGEGVRDGHLRCSRWAKEALKETEDK